MNYLVYIIFGVLPSIIWLGFYLRKDAHPEPKKMVIKIFVLGMLAALPALFLELGILGQLERMDLPVFLTSILSVFIAIALVEEILKYLVIREKVLKNSEFDEPIDAMLYMIISALGFAALENILVMFSLGPDFLIGKTLGVSAFRFLGATFLHTLCSGMIGFFLALSLLKTKSRTMLLWLGLIGATFFHGLYNFSVINPELIYKPLNSIMEVKGNMTLLLPVIILSGLGLFVFWGFGYLKKLKSVCLLNKKRRR